jgi:hypothetical protein
MQADSIAMRFFMLATFLVLSASQPSPPGGCEGSLLKRELKSFLSDNVPVIDGHISPKEWADATRFTNLVGGKNSWLCEFFPVIDEHDLSLAAGYVKHTSEGLYFAFNVTDNLHYGTDTPRWVPKGNPNANLVNASGWAFFGDEMEILLNAAGPTTQELDVAGNATQWQMVVSGRRERVLIRCAEETILTTGLPPPPPPSSPLPSLPADEHRQEHARGARNSGPDARG